MWLAIKLAAEAKLPDLGHLMRNGLGTVDAIRYRKLVEKHPGVERRHDEPLSDHLSRLDRADAADAATNPDAARRAQDPAAKVRTEETTVAPHSALPGAWTPHTVLDEPPAPASTEPALPGRPVGFFTSPESESRGFGVPPVSQRVPGNALAPSHGPSYVPQQQSMQDWVNWLRGKGITVNHQLMRPDAAQIDPGPLPQGQDIWRDFVGPTTTDSLNQHLKELPESAGGLGTSWTKRIKDLFPRRVRSSAIVNEYISGVLTGEVLPKLAAESDPAAAFWDRFNRMKKAGWDFTESGSGNHWHKEINGKHHFLVGEPDGWTHYISNSPTSYAGSMGYGPIPNLDEAVLDAKIGPLKQMALPKQQRDREEMYKSLWGETRPIGRMVPPEETNGMMQRLNSRWEDQ